MPETITGLIILAIAVLPGALYTWALEREAGNWGIGLADRVLRFIGVSAIFQSLFAYPAWTFARASLLDRQLSTLLDELPWWSWFLPVAYVSMPIATGTLAGLSVHRWPSVSRILVGRDPAPRAWDFLFSARPAGIVRVEFKDGHFAGGLFAAESYAAGYPEEPQDIYLERVYRVLEDGSFATGSDQGGFEEMGSGALLRWDEIKVLEFFDLEDERDQERDDG